MAGVALKFLFASIVMWVAPILILHGFNHHLFPGASGLSSSTMTLVSGFLAVISVNLVIALYIIMAMWEPRDPQHQPDPTFLAAAKASISQPLPSGSSREDAREKAD
ncbi:hypothetical protein AXF42_Ash007089 [Apostasia shenzhenica]|uniref:Vacuolar ATPase assembly integral membrane protein VMA21 homolog n=1 Tax=Apostasia shenzhenica TaxID=1088818 RepID=A0A2I0BF39_9ASPA|nr:hypothetical protein AXF42_Ash007089 [Apostasia shenzhenica]